ncbi:MAG: ComF family protein [Bacteroidetes bacterium]|nr:ComF family protein [Bacteroidota bacterium]
MYYFNKGGVIQELLHGLKYQQKQAIGALLGMYFAKQLLDVRWIADIDMVVPIPLSKQKLKMRGFNQSTCIGESFAANLNKPLDTTSVVRLKKYRFANHKTTRVERMDNVKTAFMVTSPNTLQHKHMHAY